MKLSKLTLSLFSLFSLLPAAILFGTSSAYGQGTTQKITTEFVTVTVPCGIRWSDLVAPNESSWELLPGLAQTYKFIVKPEVREIFFVSMNLHPKEKAIDHFVAGSCPTQSKNILVAKQFLWPLVSQLLGNVKTVQGTDLEAMVKRPGFAAKAAGFFRGLGAEYVEADHMSTLLTAAFSGAGLYLLLGAPAVVSAAPVIGGIFLAGYAGRYVTEFAKKMVRVNQLRTVDEAKTFGRETALGNEYDAGFIEEFDGFLGGLTGGAMAGFGKHQLRPAVAKVRAQAKAEAVAAKAQATANKTETPGSTAAVESEGPASNPSGIRLVKPTLTSGSAEPLPGTLVTFKNQSYVIQEVTFDFTPGTNGKFSFNVELAPVKSGQTLTLSKTLDYDGTSFKAPDHNYGWRRSEGAHYRNIFEKSGDIPDNIRISEEAYQDFLPRLNEYAMQHPEQPTLTYSKTFTVQKSIGDLQTANEAQLRMHQHRKGAVLLLNKKYVPLNSRNPEYPNSYYVGNSLKDLPKLTAQAEVTGVVPYTVEMVSTHAWPHPNQVPNKYFASAKVQLNGPPGTDFPPIIRVEIYFETVPSNGNAGALTWEQGEFLEILYSPHMEFEHAGQWVSVRVGGPRESGLAVHSTWPVPPELEPLVKDPYFLKIIKQQFQTVEAVTKSQPVPEGALKGTFETLPNRRYN